MAGSDEWHNVGLKGKDNVWSSFPVCPGMDRGTNNVRAILISPRVEVVKRRQVWVVPRELSGKRCSLSPFPNGLRFYLRYPRSLSFP